MYNSQYPHFVQYARSEVEQTLGPELAAKGGLRIYTTLDRRIQDIAQEEVAKQMAALAKQGGRNAASVTLRPATGEVLALVGSADFNNVEISGQIDMALAPRQPGSTIKPFTYLAAFEMPAAVNTDPAAVELVQAAVGNQDGTQISAIEPPGYSGRHGDHGRAHGVPGRCDPPYVPTNYDSKEHGLVSVRAALGNSYNIPGGEDAGTCRVGAVEGRCRRPPASRRRRPDYGLRRLGGGDVTLLELTGAYGTLANGGARVPVSPVACVLDAEGRLIWQGRGRGRRIGLRSGGCDPAPAAAGFQPATRSSDHVHPGRPKARKPMFASAANVMSLPGRPAAGQNRHDQRLSRRLDGSARRSPRGGGLGVGNADNKPMQKVAGSLGVAPIWHNVMARTLEGQPAAAVHAPTGHQPQRSLRRQRNSARWQACPQQREELFAAERVVARRVQSLAACPVDKLTGNRPASSRRPTGSRRAVWRSSPNATASGPLRTATRC